MRPTENDQQLAKRLRRSAEAAGKLQARAEQAQARAAGDEAKAQQYEQTASTFATQLVAAEQSMEDLKSLHDQALQAAQQAKQAVEQNAQQVQAKLAERSQLLTQLEQAKMQEQVSASLSSMSELSAPGSTPSLDEVRDKIEARYAKALGSAELAQNSVEGRMMEVQKSTLDMAGQSRLDQIRASMSGNQLAAPPAATAPPLTSGTSTASPAAEADAEKAP